MKKISIVVPTYNEEENVVLLSMEIINELNTNLPQYDYELIFTDNCSTDNTRSLIEILCKENKHIKAIFNAKNFGQNNSPINGLLSTSGDCAILICADFQDPIEMIPLFIKEWESGYRIVSAIKTTSMENKFIRFLRTCYYKMIKKMSAVEQIKHFTGFGLYDRSFIDVLRNLNDPTPFLRGIVAELGFKRKDIPYQQQRRRAGKTKNNWYSLYDLAMLSFTSYTKIGMRIATISGFIISVLSVLTAFIYTGLRIILGSSIPMGVFPIMIGVFVLGGLQIFFIGLVGEYVLSINTRVMNRPLVVEEYRINFDEANHLQDNACLGKEERYGRYKEVDKL